MDILCIIISIVKQKAKGPAYFGMQALSMLEVFGHDVALSERADKNGIKAEGPGKLLCIIS